MSSDNVRVCWLAGSYFRRRQALDYIKSQFGDCDIHVYEGNISGEYFETQALSSLLFDGKRIIILKELPKFDGSAATSTNKMKKVLSSIPDGCLVIIDGVETSKSSAIADLVKKIGRLHEYPKYLKNGDAISWVSEYAEKKGKQFEEGCEQLVVNAMGEVYSHGVDIDKLYLCTQKLFDYLGSTKKVTQADVFAVLGNNRDFIIWKLFDSLDKRDFKGCMKHLNNAIALEKSPKDALPQILHMITWRYRLLMFLKESSRLGKKHEEILSDLKSLKKIKRQGSDIYSEFEYDTDDKGKPKEVYGEKVAKNALSGLFGSTPAVDMYRMPEIYNILKSVSYCLFRMRNSSNESEMMMLLNGLFMTICGVLDPRSLENLRKYSYG